MKKTFQILTGILLGLLVVAGLLLFAPGNPIVPPGGDPSGDGWNGTPIATEGGPPAVVLEGHDGSSFMLGDLEGSVVVLFFGFTHCPDVCPATMATLSRAIEALGPGASGLRTVFVTVDPERDTKERLAEWLAPFHPSIVGVRAAEQDLLALAATYGAFYQVRSGSASPTPAQSGHGAHEHGSPAEGASGGSAIPDGIGTDPGTPPPPVAVEHSGRAYVLDRKGRLVLTFQPWLDAGGMVSDLSRLLGRNAPGA